MTRYYDDKPWLKTYPEWFAPDFATPSESVLAKFRHAADRVPDAPCIYYFDTRYSFAEVEKMAASLAAALSQKGVAKGDRILFVLQNIPQAIIGAIAVWMRGAIVVPVNPMYTTRDLKHLIADSGARCVVCEDSLYEKTVCAAAGECTVITTSPLDLIDADGGLPEQLKTAKKKTFESTYDFMTLIREFTGSRIEEIDPAPEDLAYLVYTSGTTGPPKGAMISHANIHHNCLVYESTARLDRSDVVLGIAPMFHITGIVAHLAIAFHMGIPIILFNRFDARDVLRLIEKHQATFTVASITVYIALLNHPDVQSFNIAHFQKAYSGGAPVSPSTVGKFKEAMGLTIHNVYGLTESTSPATIAPLGQNGPVDEASGALSVGLIIPGIEAWVVDVDNPETLMPPGEEGELVLRGPSIVSGYWQKPEETAAAIRGGRFHTGDVAKIDEAGWCYIVDRKKDLINVSGFKVWPRDVEDVLYRHPGVKEAAVVGVPDSYRGETVKAFVSLSDGFMGKTTPEELIRFCKDRLAAYKYPRIVEIIEDVPKTTTGKMLRRELRGR
ncbi:MAG: AMP-binding protein [Deltaproteobacteria bacterium]|nr:AMP-binding protein [Deltaproteobacteria bacterium]